MIFSAESRYNQWVREHYRFLLRSAWALTPWYARRGLQILLAAVVVCSAGLGRVLALRGNFMAEIARHLDWPRPQKLPGYARLMRSCDIDGARAYHLHFL